MNWRPTTTGRLESFSLGHRLSGRVFTASRNDGRRETALMTRVRGDSEEASAGEDCWGVGRPSEVDTDRLRQHGCCWPERPKDNSPGQDQPKRQRRWVAALGSCTKAACPLKGDGSGVK